MSPGGTMSGPSAMLSASGTARWESGVAKPVTHAWRQPDECGLRLAPGFCAANDRFIGLQIQTAAHVASLPLFSHISIMAVPNLGPRLNLTLVRDLGLVSCWGRTRLDTLSHCSIRRNEQRQQHQENVRFHRLSLSYVLSIHGLDVRARTEMPFQS